MAIPAPPRSGVGAQSVLSVEVVTEAVSAVMRASDRDGVIDQALASRIGARILPEISRTLNGRISSGSELLGQQGFRTILSQHLSLVGQEDDTRALRKFLRDNANRTGADFAALVAQYRRGGGWNGRMETLDAHADREDGAAADSSHRFDDTFLRSPAGRELQAHALRHGLGWAVDRPDILRLGKDAIELFARTNFRRESFDSLREVGFEGRQIKRLVQRAEESGQDANELARVHRDSVRIFGGNDAQERQRWINRFDAFNTNPRDEAAWQDLDRSLRRMEQEGSQEQRDQAHRQREASERIRNARLGANLTTTQATVAADQAVTAVSQLDAAATEADNLFGAPPAATPPAPVIVTRDVTNQGPAAQPPPAALQPPAQPASVRP